jgi:hypothetical protein
MSRIRYYGRTDVACATESQRPSCFLKTSVSKTDTSEGRTASTTLRNSTIAPSPVRLTTWPLCTAMVGSIRSLRSARSPRQNPVLVGSGQQRIADHVGHQDRGQFSGLAHGATPPRPCQPRTGWGDGDRLARSSHQAERDPRSFPVNGVYRRNVRL